MQNIAAKIIHVQLEANDRFYAKAEIVVPDKFEHIEFFLNYICSEAHAPPLSDVEAGTYTFSISGEGKPPFDIGQSIMTRAFERGELPV